MPSLKITKLYYLYKRDFYNKDINFNFKNWIKYFLIDRTHWVFDKYGLMYISADDKESFSFSIGFHTFKDFKKFYTYTHDTEKREEIDKKYSKKNIDLMRFWKSIQEDIPTFITIYNLKCKQEEEIK